MNSNSLENEFLLECRNEVQENYWSDPMKTFGNRALIYEEALNELNYEDDPRLQGFCEE